MLTPEQQKLFRFFFLLGKSYGVSEFEFDFEFDDDLPGWPFDISDFSRAYVRREFIEIPQKAAQELTDFMNEKVFPELESSLEQLLESNDVDQASTIRLSVTIDIDSRNFSAKLSANWYSFEEAETEVSDLPDDVHNEISSTVPTGEVVRASLEYTGGGDSGEWGSEIEVSTKEGQTYMFSIGESTDNWVSYNLPSGWEIDEGSSGTVVFDLEKKEIYINHTWNTYDEGTQSILDFDF